MEHCFLCFDGGARPNPGYGGAGFVIYDIVGHVVAKSATPVRMHPCTNNQAEYIALILGLREVARRNPDRVSVRGDSKLVIEQMRGNYKVTSRKLAGLYDTAKELADSLHYVDFGHVSRSQNTCADSLRAELSTKGESGRIEDIPVAALRRYAVMPLLQGPTCGYDPRALADDPSLD